MEQLEEPADEALVSVDPDIARRDRRVELPAVPQNLDQRPGLGCDPGVRSVGSAARGLKPAIGQGFRNALLADPQGAVFSVSQLLAAG